MFLSDNIVNLYDRKVTVHYVYDGDTITAYEMDKGFGETLTCRRGENRGLRLVGINAPEKTSPEHVVSLAILKRLEGKTIIGRSHKYKVGKYGRYLFQIFAPVELFTDELTQLDEPLQWGNNDYVDVGLLMLKMGIVNPMNGEMTFYNNSDY